MKAKIFLLIFAVFIVFIIYDSALETTETIQNTLDLSQTEDVAQSNQSKKDPEPLQTKNLPESSGSQDTSESGSIREKPKASQPISHPGIESEKAPESSDEKPVTTNPASSAEPIKLPETKVKPPQQTSIKEDALVTAVNEIIEFEELPNLITRKSSNERTYEYKFTNGEVIKYTRNGPNDSIDSITFRRGVWNTPAQLSEFHIQLFAVIKASDSTLSGEATTALVIDLINHLSAFSAENGTPKSETKGQYSHMSVGKNSYSLSVWNTPQDDNGHSVFLTIFVV